MIPYGKHIITSGDKNSVLKVLNSNWLTQGPLTSRFEQTINNYTGSKFSVAFNSATSALHIACLSLDVGPGDIVWTSPNSFVASANCAVYCGAKIDFVDINKETLNMDIDLLEKKLKISKKKNLPKVIIPVHFAGLPCDMQRIKKLSKKYKFKIIEDASHAIGSSYKLGNKKKVKVGSCLHSDITIFSFHPVKIITTAEGGLATTNNKKLASRMSLLRTHGITKDQNLMKKKVDGPWFYQQLELGYNYRMNDIQAALGIEQIKRLDRYVDNRNKIAKIYKENIKDLTLSYQNINNKYLSSYHLFVIILDKKYKKLRLKIFNYLRKNGIGVAIHYIPIHTHPFYSKKGFSLGDFPVSEDYYRRAISLPIYPGLSKMDQLFIIRSLKKALI